MRTLEDISRDDWEQVRLLSTNLYNALDTPDERPSREALLQYLMELEERYGRLPSILAARADFVEDAALKGQLLHESYTLAVHRDDRVNALYIAHSLAEYFVEDLERVEEGEQWLERLSFHLAAINDPQLTDERKRLAIKLRNLRSR